jgi:NAD-dependent SIR2 family protein deacetylase
MDTLWLNFDDLIGLIRAEIQIYRSGNRGAPVIKLDIVLYGEGFDEADYDKFNANFWECDLLSVIGTSLIVAPGTYSFAGIIRDDIPRLFVNEDIMHPFEKQIEMVDGEMAERAAGDTSNY